MSARLEAPVQTSVEKLQLALDEPPAMDFSSRWRGALARSPLLRPLRSPWAGLATCLMYHRVCPDRSASGDTVRRFAPNRDLSVTLSAFDQQMAFVARHFNCLSLPEAVEGLLTGKLPARSLIVTFDDGYLDNLTLALPILRRHAVPATIYIATGMIDRLGLPWWYELEELIAISEEVSLRWQGQDLQLSTRNAVSKQQAFKRLNLLLKQMDPIEQASFMGLLREGSIQCRRLEAQLMSRDQVIELASDPLITIGAHTHNHLSLQSLTPERLRYEIVRSKSLLEAWLRQPIEHLAYPFGGRLQASEREFSAAAEIGFASAVTTRLGHFQSFHKKSLTALPRIGVGYDDCMARFEWKLSGLYCMARRPISRLLC